MAALGCGLGLCLRWRMLLGWDREANSAPAAPPMRPAGRRWIADRRLAAGRLLAGRGVSRRSGPWGAFGPFGLLFADFGRLVLGGLGCVY